MITIVMLFVSGCGDYDRKQYLTMVTILMLFVYSCDENDPKRYRTVVIAMLLVFLIVHINMLFPGNQLGVSLWILILRIPIQFVLIYWAYQYL